MPVMAGIEQSLVLRGRTLLTVTEARCYVYKGFNIDSAGAKLPLAPRLVKKVSKGGKGEWNEYIPMAPNDPNGIHLTQITNIVNFILSIPSKE